MNSPGAPWTSIDVDVAATPGRIELVSTDSGLLFHIAIDGGHVGAPDLEIYRLAGLVIGAACTTHPPIVPGTAPGGKRRHVAITMGNPAQYPLQRPGNTPSGARICHGTLATNAVQAGQAGTSAECQRYRQQKRYRPKGQPGPE